MDKEELVWDKVSEMSRLKNLFASTKSVEVEAVIDSGVTL
jgi:hypothetical protein